MRLLLGLLLIAAFFNALSWIILIPLWQYPDEQAHFAQVQDIAELGKRPTDKLNTSLEIALSEKILGTERDGMGNNKFTYHPEYKLDYSDSYFGPQESEILNLPKSAKSQLVKNEATLNPPLYYFLASIPYKLMHESDLFTRVYVTRLLSLSFFILLIIVTYQISKEIFKKNAILRIILTSLIVFKPMLVFSSTGILPDPLTNLLFSIVLLICAIIVKKGPSLKEVTLFVIVLIAGILTRQHFLMSLPIFAFAILINFVKHKKFKELIFLTGLSLVVFILINYSPNAIPEIATVNYSLLLQKSFPDYFIWTAKHSVAETLPWYWGVYKWLSLTLPPINYQIINRLIALSLIGLIIRAISIVRKRKIENLDLYLIFFIGASIIYFAIFAFGDYFFNRLYGYSFGIQGRYFFPMIIPHFAILIIGFWQIAQLLFKRFAKYLLIFIVFLMVLFNNVSLGYISASYYETTSISTFVKQASQYKPSLIKGNIILLIILITFGAQGLFLFNLIKYAKKSAD